MFEATARNRFQCGTAWSPLEKLPINAPITVVSLSHIVSWQIKSVSAKRGRRGKGRDSPDGPVARVEGERSESGLACFQDLSARSRQFLL